MKNECTKCAESIRNDLNKLFDGETVDECESLIDYLCENALDIEYTLDSNKQLIGVRIYVTLGGPTCWIDTRNGEVVCAWGTDRAAAWLASEICDEINDFYAECMTF